MRSHDHNRQQAGEYLSKANAEKSDQAAVEIYKQVLIFLDCIKIKYDSDIRLLINAHYSLGSCYFNLKCFTHAADYYARSLANHDDIRHKDENDYRRYIQGSMSKCYTQLELKNIPLAAQFFTDCITTFAEKITNKTAEEKSLGDNIIQNPKPFYYYWSNKAFYSHYLESDHCRTLNHDAVLSPSQSAAQDGSTAEVTAMFNLLKLQNTTPQVSVVQQPQPRIPWAFYQPHHPVQINVAAPVATANSESDNAMDIDDKYQPPTP